ncbi:protein phosphatase Slingshot homolog 1 isoform X5 [Phyllopteryx taeniolatus]|uniref:protein phosphatase Slingshot homolog 1 isoform X5 n=1 Tax=Phyllopteryx taeniolatus TaxID=161469 RepID=UPI002AD46839|nr:protein phosphatase Slingshot homolog 1 isoform X5 [Phyllopteryx taeniolatus]
MSETETAGQRRGVKTSTPLRILEVTMTAKITNASRRASSWSRGPPSSSSRAAAPRTPRPPPAAHTRATCLNTCRSCLRASARKIALNWRCDWRAAGRSACDTCWWCTPAAIGTRRSTSCSAWTSPTKTEKAAPSGWCCRCGATPTYAWMATGPECFAPTGPHPPHFAPLPGFSVKTAGRSHVFKPVSVQAMWCALQAVHKACEVSRRFSYFPGGPSLRWTAFYEGRVSSEQSCVNEWNAMTDLETTRPDSPATFGDQPSERERTESLIKAKLRGIMTFRDLENITSKEIRNELEQHMSCDLKEFKEFIDNEMLLILGQMDKATLIFDHVYLGSEWNASNLDELRECGVGYILNMTREIDNFFPGSFSYHNVRVNDDDATDLLAHWNDTYNFIVKARKNSSKCLVHCKMGVSRSASTVMAYAMKEYGWSLEKAYNFVKHKRSIAQPNAGFMRQLAEYQGILDASKQRHNKLWRPGIDEEASDDMPVSSQVAGQQGDEEEAWGLCGASPCRGLEMEPLDSLNYNYYFRRLSDSALDSEPSTPVRGPPLLGMERVFIEIEDVERDALLEDEGFPVAHLALPGGGGGGGTGAQTCGRLDPLEDMRLRLEFSTLEEEDEEEAKKEEAEMAALEGKKHVEESRLGLANLNTNNSNRLAAKRSCPAAFDDSASTGNPFKVKPSYQSCKDCCLRLPQGRRCDRPAGSRSHRLNPSRHCTLPTICIDPPGTIFISQSLPNLAPPLPVQYCSSAGVPLSRQKLVSPMSCEDPTHACALAEAEAMDQPEAEGQTGPQAGSEIAEIE